MNKARALFYVAGNSFQLFGHVFFCQSLSPKVAALAPGVFYKLDTAKNGNFAACLVVSSEKRVAVTKSLLIQIYLDAVLYGKEHLTLIPKWAAFSATSLLTTFSSRHSIAAKYKGICPKFLRPTQGPDKCRHVYFLESGLRDRVKGKISPISSQVYWK